MTHIGDVTDKIRSKLGQAVGNLCGES